MPDTPASLNPKRKPQTQNPKPDTLAASQKRQVQLQRKVSRQAGLGFRAYRVRALWI